MKAPWRFLAAYGGVVGLGLLGVAAFNHAVDPAHLFRPGLYEAHMAGLLARPSHVAATANYDERLLQKYWVSQLKQIPPTVVLGSSRMMQVGLQPPDPSMLTNHAVSGATLEDLLAVWQMLETRGSPPEHIILGIDPWMLNPKHGQQRWRSVRHECAQLSQAWGLPVQAPPGPAAQGARWRELVSGTYLLESWKSWRKARAGEAPEARPSAEAEGPVAVRRSDGTLSYPEAFRKRTAGAVRQDALDYARKRPIYSLADFFAPGASELRLLDAFLEALSRRTRVLVVLVPYHPEVYQAIRGAPETAGVVRAEEEIRRIAARLDLPVAGSYDPQQAGLTGEDFYDGMHARAGAMARLLSRTGSGSFSPKGSENADEVPSWKTR